MFNIIDVLLVLIAGGLLGFISSLEYNKQLLSKGALPYKNNLEQALVELMEQTKNSQANTSYLLKRIMRGEIVRIDVWGIEPNQMKLNRILGNFDFIHYTVERYASSAEYSILIQLKKVGK